MTNREWINRVADYDLLCDINNRLKESTSYHLCILDLLNHDSWMCRGMLDCEECLTAWMKEEHV